MTENSFPLMLDPELAPEDIASQLAAVGIPYRDVRAVIDDEAKKASADPVLATWLADVLRCYGSTRASDEELAINFDSSPAENAARLMCDVGYDDSGYRRVHSSLAALTRRFDELGQQEQGNFITAVIAELSPALAAKPEPVREVEQPAEDETDPVAEARDIAARLGVPDANDDAWRRKIQALDEEIFTNRAGPRYEHLRMVRHEVAKLYRQPEVVAELPKPEPVPRTNGERAVANIRRWYRDALADGADMQAATVRVVALAYADALSRAEAAEQAAVARAQAAEEAAFERCMGVLRHVLPAVLRKARNK